MDIYLIRHTRVQGVNGICYGRSEVPLAADFMTDAEEVKRKLPTAEHPVYLSSPSRRCRTLAEFLSDGPYDIVPELGELDFGLWEMQAWDAIPRDSLDRWARDYLNHPCPQGESLKDMRDRVLHFWEGLTQHRSSPIVVITHAGPIRVILSHLLKIPAQELFSLAADFGGVSRITSKFGKARIEFMNK